MTRAAILALLLAGCVQVGPKEMPTAPVACPSWPDMPGIPRTVHLVIEPGKPPQADDGARVLLRSYVHARELLQ